MTTYLITEAQIALFKKVVGAAEGFHFIADRAMIIEADNMLQSLRMVDSEPVGLNPRHPDFVAGFKEGCKSGRLRGAAAARKELEAQYTSPQALTQISADDVTDEMLKYFTDQYKCGSVNCNEDEIAAAYNAVIKHKSEAK